MYAVTITSFAAALMGTVVTAQTSSVVDLWLVGFDYQYNASSQAPYVGSIIASDATATTYSITCGSTTAAPATTSSGSFDFGDDCGVPDSFTFTQGPSTVAFTYTMDDAYDDLITASAFDTASGSASTDVKETYTLGCVVSDSSSASCTYTIRASDASTTAVSTDATAVTGTEYATIFTGVPVTITAGPASTSGSGSATKTSSGASASGTNKSGASGSGSSSASSSKTSTGGMPMITAKAQWVVGGAAAAMFMAAL